MKTSKEEKQKNREKFKRNPKEWFKTQLKYELENPKRAIWNFTKGFLYMFIAILTISVLIQESSYCEGTFDQKPFNIPKSQLQKTYNEEWMPKHMMTHGVGTQPQYDIYCYIDIRRKWNELTQ